MNTGAQPLLVYDSRIATLEGSRADDPARLNYLDCYTEPIKDLPPATLDETIGDFHVIGIAKRTLVNIVLGRANGIPASQTQKKMILFTGTLAILGSEQHGSGNIRLVSDTTSPFSDAEGLRELILGPRPYSLTRVDQLLKGLSDNRPTNVNIGYCYSPDDGTTTWYHFRTRQDQESFLHPDRLVENGHTI